MKQIYPDLWQTDPEHPFPGSPRVSTHAYLLLRNGGNVLFYSSGHSDDYRRIQALGGITHQYLSHKDEAGPPLVRIKQMFGSKLCCHRLEEKAVSEASPVDLAFEKREIHLGDIEVIPTPGHTPGSTCFLFKSPHGKSYLFTGDTIYRNDEPWENGFLSGVSSKSDLKKSLELLRGLEPDVVISSASIGPFPFTEMSAGEWQAAVDEALRPLS
ncbi:MBL fold metallo-hydrolase [Rhodospirillaceae bacterium SYSU D60014]|uniref:MBL fold metallo-hydrolase n=1 Tax=Virgifigura deserti TaxID=2268457 RepID=UPI000E66EEE1